jgi:hypothetical protein
MKKKKDDIKFLKYQPVRKKQKIDNGISKLKIENERLRKNIEEMKQKINVNNKNLKKLNHDKILENFITKYYSYIISRKSITFLCNNPNYIEDKQRMIFGLYGEKRTLKDKHVRDIKISGICIEKGNLDISYLGVCGPLFMYKKYLHNLSSDGFKDIEDIDEFYHERLRGTKPYFLDHFVDKPTMKEITLRATNWKLGDFDWDDPVFCEGESIFDTYMYVHKKNKMKI